MKHGNDKIEISDESYYKGEFLKNHFHGKGKFEDKSSFANYEGEFKNSLRN